MMESFSLQKSSKKFKASLLGSTVFFLSVFLSEETRSVGPENADNFCEKSLSSSPSKFSSDEEVSSQETNLEEKKEFSFSNHPIWEKVFNSEAFKKEDFLKAEVKRLTGLVKDRNSSKQAFLLSESYENLKKPGRGQDWEDYRELINFEEIKEFLEKKDLEKANDSKGITQFFCKQFAKEVDEFNDIAKFEKNTPSDGCGGNEVHQYKFRDDPKFSFVIKTFKKVDEGIKELLDSMISYNLNPAPSKLKMARVVDAVLWGGEKEEKLSLMIEGANTNNIHHFLNQEEEIGVSTVKAVANYLATFHLENYEHTKGKELQYRYLIHEAESFLKTEDNRSESGGVKLGWIAGEQEKNIQPLNAENVHRFLSKEEQKVFENIVFFRREEFRENCQNIASSFKDGKSPSYFLTRTHGDAHGKNLFYDPDSSQVCLIDYSTLCRTYWSIGDPAEDVGRFLGSLWEWASRPLEDDKGKEKEGAYLKDEKKINRIKKLEEGFLDNYLNNFQKQNFKTIFSNNREFYKLRYLKAIFNTPTKDEELETLKKDQAYKLTLLRTFLHNNLLTEEEEIKLEEYRNKRLIKMSEKRPWNKLKISDVEHNLPLPPENFVEAMESKQKSYLTKLWEALESAENPRTFCLFGMGGIGKTTLALRYAHEALQEKAYHRIYWILSETEKDIFTSYEKIKKPSILNNSLSELAKSITESKPNNEKWLVIYENVPDPKQHNEKMLKGNGIYSIVTSRCQDNQNNINLDVFDTASSVNYFFEITGFSRSKKLEEAVIELVEKKLGNLPLALSHAAHYFRSEKEEKILENSIKKYSENFDPFDPKKPDYEEIVNKTFELAQEKISETAKETLFFCSYLHPDHISRSMLCYGLNDKRIDEDLEDLNNYSLIKKDGTKDMISAHRLVQTVVRNHHKNEKTESKIAEKLKEMFSTLYNLFDASYTGPMGYNFWPKDPLPENFYNLGQEKEDNFPDLSVALYRKAAKKNHLESINKLNQMYKIRENVKRKGAMIDELNYMSFTHLEYIKPLLSGLFDDEYIQKFKKVYKENAENGYPETQFKIAYELRENGNYEEALYWLMKCAENGDDESQLFLVYEYMEGKNKNYLEALRWLNELEKKDFGGLPQGGVGMVHHYFGEIYSNGAIDSNGAITIKKDHKKALNHYKEAVERGRVEAMLKLGEIYSNGVIDSNGAIIIKKDHEKPFDHYKKALERGHVGAMLKLGVIYCQRFFKEFKKLVEMLEGMSIQDYLDQEKVVNENYQLALKCYEISAEKGSTEAKILIEEANQIYQQACETISSLLSIEG